MINLNDYLDCPEKLQFEEGTKVVSIKKHKNIDFTAILFVLELADERVYISTIENMRFQPIQQERWQGLRLSIYGNIVSAQLGITHSSFENATQSTFNAALNLDTLEVRRK